MAGGAEKSPDEVLFLLGLFSGLDHGSALIEALEAVVDKMDEPEDRIWTQKFGFSFLENRSEAALRNMFRLAFETSLVDDAIMQPGFFERTKRLVSKYQLLAKSARNEFSNLLTYDKKAMDRLETVREFYVRLCEKSQELNIKGKKRHD